MPFPSSMHNNWPWNLMCRSFNVSLPHAPSLGWAGDCISVHYGQDKTKKDGGKRNKTVMMKHLFENPFEPQVRHLSTIRHTHLRHLHARHTGLPFCLSWITHWSSSYYRIKKKRQNLTQGLFPEDAVHVASRLTNRH